MVAYKKDYIFYGIVIAFSIFFLIETVQIHSANNTTVLGPKFWPLTLLTLMLIFAVIGIIRTYINHKKIEIVNTTEAEEQERRFYNIPLSILSISSIILYSVGVYFIGFIISTLIFLFLLTQVLGAKKKLLLIVTSIIVTAIVVWLFSIVLSVPLPRGIGIFRELSFLFY